MSLYVVATPIGNMKDLSQRAIETLKTCDLIIGEEKRETEILLKRIEAFPKTYELLNEHSAPDDIRRLAQLCQNQNVALISDCGTPGFCDPGADLVKLVRQSGGHVTPIPGASSLMTLLSVTGHRLDKFLFYGFLPRESESRAMAWSELKKSKIPVVLMDTPYRLKKFWEEAQIHVPEKKFVLGCDLTQETEQILEGTPNSILKQIKKDKSEFIAVLLT